LGGQQGIVIGLADEHFAIPHHVYEFVVAHWLSQGLLQTTAKQVSQFQTYEFLRSQLSI